MQVALSSQHLPARHELLADSVYAPHPSSAFDENYKLVPFGANSPQLWLADSPLLQLEHPRIRILATRLTQRYSEAAGKAVACYEYVRAIHFQFVPGGRLLSAPEVIQMGHGDGRTKATLLVAMLRAVGIAARIRMLSLPPYFLRGLLTTEGKLFKHVITEVMVGDAWVGVDTYIFDPTLTLAVRSRLERESRSMGYCLHAQAHAGWNGQRSAFGHFRAADPQSAPRRNWGAYSDIAGFYEHNPSATRTKWKREGLARVSVALANKRIVAMRHSRMPAEAWR